MLATLVRSTSRSTILVLVQGRGIVAAPNPGPDSTSNRKLSHTAGQRETISPLNLWPIHPSPALASDITRLLHRASPPVRPCPLTPALPPPPPSPLTQVPRYPVPPVSSLSALLVFPLLLAFYEDWPPASPLPTHQAFSACARTTQLYIHAALLTLSRR